MEKGRYIINNIVQTLLQVLYPLRCIVCGRILGQEEEGVCRECRPVIPVITGNRCIVCSKQTAESDVCCRDCSNRKHIYESGYALWSYNSISRKIVAGIKYSGRRDSLCYIGSELAYHTGILCKAWNARVVMPVPLHKKKLRQRGFNQAAVIAKEIADRLGLCYIDDVLYRVKNTRPQKYFDGDGRRANLKNAFEVDVKRLNSYGDIANVILVDDIYTSGSTIDECAGVLKSAGIKKIYFICLCIGDGY